MELNIKEFGKIIKQMGKVNFFILMEISSKVNGNKIS